MDLTKVSLASLYQKRHEASERSRKASYIPIATKEMALARLYTYEISKRPFSEVLEAIKCA